jgi:hypothetical protein
MYTIPLIVNVEHEYLTCLVFTCQRARVCRLYLFMHVVHHCDAIPRLQHTVQRVDMHLQSYLMHRREAEPLERILVTDPSIRYSCMMVHYSSHRTRRYSALHFRTSLRIVIHQRAMLTQHSAHVSHSILSIPCRALRL